MKIVDRKTFMQMPKGTVFCKFPRFNENTRSYEGYPFSIGEPQIKMLDTGKDAKDFYSLHIGSDLLPVGYESDLDKDDTLMDMERNPGKEVPFEYDYGRDGFYEGDEVGFAIFSRSEVQEMINVLQQALEDGYKNNGLHGLN